MFQALWLVSNRCPSSLHKFRRSRVCPLGTLLETAAFELFLRRLPGPGPASGRFGELIEAPVDVLGNVFYV